MQRWGQGTEVKGQQEEVMPLGSRESRDLGDGQLVPRFGGMQPVPGP